MRLIIAEKHSVGQAIAQALGGHAEKHDGYIQVGDDLVTWAQGHLVDLAAPDEYQGHDWGRWSLDTLPIDPTPDWQWKVSREKGADRQYKIVAGLMRRDDTDSLVNACDPDREGEAIFRRIVAHAGVSKPMRRLWVASLEEDAIRAALESMRDETDYQGLADAAMIRAQADWLIGMNASRAYSLVYNARFTVGRVQTPTLAMIVDRDRDIAGHVARPYWKVVAPMGGWKLAGERLDKREDAETLLRIVNSDDFAFSIFKAERQQQHDAPPHLYDLTGLQKDMSRLHGLTAARTLTALQSLYEKRLTTYPRTDSQYITHDDLDTLRGLAEGDRLVAGFIEPSAKPERPRLGLTVNDAKVAGHTAILPTMQADKAALDELGDDERLVLVRVARRMWEAVGDDYVHDVTNVVANIDPHWCEKHPDEGRLLSEGECRFTSRSDQPVALGWRAVEHAAPQEDQGEEDETTCRRKGTRNRSETAHAAASPSSKRARCSNAPPTGERSNPTAHGIPRRDAAGAPGRPSPARPSPT
ncbi:DNA topoisomerase 3 [Bifidobacterium breve]|nr:DNA topoisomerase 3 [Bifidobacterium breve]